MTNGCDAVGDVILKLHQVAMRFGGVDALGGVNCAIAPGIIHAVIGPNGAGKTTLFNCISGLLRPTGGAIELDGRRREERHIKAKALEHLDFVGLAAGAALPAGTLPLGQQKVLEIARALATEPRLLLLDEPAGGLNMKETEELGELIQRVCRLGTTVLLVEHDMNLVMEISDRILVLHYGQRLALGSPREIKDNPAVIEAYLGE